MAKKEQIEREEALSAKETPVAVQASADPAADNGGEERLTLPETLPVLPLRDQVLFPAVVVPLAVGRPGSMQLIDDAALEESRIIAITAQKDPSVDEPHFNDVQHVGVVAVIRMMAKGSDGVRIIVQGMSRIRLLEATQESPYLVCRVEALEDIVPEGEAADVEMTAMARRIGRNFQRLVQMSSQLPDELQAIPQNVTEPSTLVDLVAAHLELSLEKKQELLAEQDVHVRLRELLGALARELNVMEIGSRIEDEVTGELTKTQRHYYLREQLKAIQKELGVDDDRATEIEELREQLEQAQLPEHALKEAERELARLERMPPGAAEYSVTRTYLDWLLILPWNQSTKDNLDIQHAKQILDEDHYDLEKIKDRILEYLSVQKFMKGRTVRHPILCFVGPPGVGKTSLGRSIARAVGREFARMSLGGMRDEAEIRGHRRTYIGALPGQIIQAIRRAGSNNPVLMLDEIDKLGRDFRGDPASALLEVLDPEQNKDFRDHYLDVRFDLSKTLFITTANVLDTIPAPLRDRMEIIGLPGYTEEDKLQIARSFLVPKQIEEHGLTVGKIKWDDQALRLLSRGYTREAGVRNLDREIAAVTRKVTRLFAEGRKRPIRVTRKKVQEFLGAPRFEYEEVRDRVEQPGVAIGLAWTPFGGDVLFIEAMAMPGNGRLKLTGKLGDVMKESAEAAYSIIRSRCDELCARPDFFRKQDVHIHIPAGAIPKDGPSAGVTMLTALASLVGGRKVRPQVAMTGEITLTGRVLPVGGIKEKVLAAQRAGIKEIILPERNRKDIEEDVPEEIRQELTFHFVRNVDEAMRLALEPPTELVA